MILLLYIVIILLLYITMPSEMIDLGKESILIWYNSIFPVLFPSMIIAGILLPFFNKINPKNKLIKHLAYILGITEVGLFAVIPGFLCGFPIGSYVAKNLLDKKMISLNEAQKIIGFSNNIGPIYFLSTITSNISNKSKIIFALLFYSIPIIYVLLWNLFEKLTDNYHKRINMKLSKSNENYAYNSNSKELTSADIKITHNCNMNILSIIDDSINNSIESILRLCAYIFLSRTLLIFPIMLSSYFSINKLYLAVTNALIEITSGINLFRQIKIDATKLIFIEIPFLIFGGFCSIAQTACIIRNSELSLGKYILHKSIQGILATIICTFLYLLI